MSIQRTVFLLFEGNWKLSREMRGSYNANFVGNASFQQETGESSKYSYFESGQLHMQGEGKFASKQRYLYELQDSGVDVFKQEKTSWEFMHHLRFVKSLNGYEASHTHQCGKDYYSVVYHVVANERFQVEYTILGPQKKYSINSFYSKI